MLTIVRTTRTNRSYVLLVYEDRLARKDISTIGVWYI